MAGGLTAPLDELSFSTLGLPTLERLKTSGGVPPDPGGSPRRIVGFPETPLSPHSVLGTSNSPILSRQSSLTELLLQPGELMVASPRLAIRTTTKGSSAALRSGQPSRARSSAQIFRITPPVAAAEYKQQYRQGAARRIASAMVFPTGPVVDATTTCLALSRLHHSSSLQIPRMHHASTCPTELDEDLVAAALRAYPTVGTPPSSLPSDNPLSRESRGGSASTSPCSSYGTAASTLPPSPWAAHFFRSAQQTHAGLTRQLFDAQAEAATAHAQVHCLQEALTKERSHVERLEAEVARLQMQLGELQGSSATQLRLALSRLQDSGTDSGGTEGDSGRSAAASGYDTAYGSPVDGAYGSALEECPPTVPSETALPLDSPFDWSQ